MICVWLCLIAVGVSTVVNAQSCDERAKAEVTNPGNTQYLVTLKKEDGKARWFKLTFSRPLISINSGEARFVKKIKSSYWFKLYRYAWWQLKRGATRIRVQVQFTQNAPVPSVTSLVFAKKTICGGGNSTTDKKKCVDKIANTDCNSYLTKKRGTEDSEFGALKLPTPGKLNSWKIVVGFADEVQNLQLVSTIPSGRECNKIFRSYSPPHKMRVRRKKKYFWYRMHYSRDYVERPKVSYIFFGSELCNQTCGTIPVCPPPTTKEPTTQPPVVTTQAPPEETTQAPPEETTQAPPEETTEAPPEETTEAPPEETTEAPPEETTQAPPEETTQAPPEETTQAPPEETTETPPEETTQAPPEETTEAPPPEETTQAPPEETTEAPPEETTEAPPPEETTQAPPEETTQAPPEETTEAPPEETTQAPPEETTQAPPEETTQAPPPEETTEAPPPEETTQAPPPEETTEAPPPEETTEAPPPEGTTEAPSEETTEAPPPEETTEAPPTPADEQEDQFEGYTFNDVFHS